VHFDLLRLLAKALDEKAVHVSQYVLYPLGGGVIKESVVDKFLDFACSDWPNSILQKACEKVESDPLALVAAIIVAIAALAFAPLRQFIVAALKSIYFRLRVVWTSGSRLERARESVSLNGRGPWLTVARSEPRDYSLRMESAIVNLPVTVCANLKGGVGKTTVAANVAARFAALKEKPVLAIDLDYQGSLSSMMFSGTKWQPSRGSLCPASFAVLGHKSSDWLCSEAHPATWVKNPEEPTRQIFQVPNLKGISAFHDLAEVEDRVKLLWAIADEKRDIRYFLYDLLHSDAFRDRFSMVFIDAPPRLTTGCIQALAASTHVLIPTVLDDLSADAVGYFGKQLRRHEELWPNLRVLGVIGSMTEGQNHERPALTASGDALRQSLDGCTSKLYALRASGIPLEFPYELAICQRASLARAAGKGIAYASLANNQEAKEIRALFGDLATEMMRRMQA
jgi:chromosome partitioning protein